MVGEAESHAEEAHKLRELADAKNLGEQLAYQTEKALGEHRDKLESSDAYERAADAVGLGDRTGGFLYVDIDGLLPVVESLTGGALSPDDRRTIQQLDAFVLESSGGGETTTLTGFLQLND